MAQCRKTMSYLPPQRRYDPISPFLGGLKLAHAIALRDLCYFRAVAATQNIHRATDELGIDPPLARSIREFEDKLRVAPSRARAQRHAPDARRRRTERT